MTRIGTWLLASARLPAAKMAGMDVEQMQEYCLAKPGAWADNPWGHEHPVIKVGEDDDAKIFAFLGSSGVGLKCGPSRDAADEWLEHYPGDVKVMAYIGRSGWNDLSFRGQIPEDELLEAVDDSYQLVVTRDPEEAPAEGLGRPASHSRRGRGRVLTVSPRRARSALVRLALRPTRRATTSAT